MIFFASSDAAEDSAQLVGLVEQTHGNVGALPAEVSADGSYASGPNLATPFGKLREAAQCAISDTNAADGLGQEAGLTILVEAVWSGTAGNGASIGSHESRTRVGEDTGMGAAPQVAADAG
jgi:hypothetical protein